MSLLLNSQKHISHQRHSINEVEYSVRSQKSIHSEGLIQKQQDRNSQIFFSFNNGQGQGEHSEKGLLDKNASVKKMKVLEEELKSCKSRSNLWQKTKCQMLNLNKYLKLSSISLSCSDSAILKQFFESVAEMLMAKHDKKNDQKSVVVDAKKKQAQLFEKLVETKKAKYELQQKLVHYEHEISKLSDINDSLRQKSRAQSTDVSSKMRQFHEESLMTIHQKDQELNNIQMLNSHLKQQISQLQSKISAIQAKIERKTSQLIDAQTYNKELLIQREILHTKACRLEEQEAKYESSLQEVKEELSKIVQQNIAIRIELKKRGQLIVNLRSIVGQAKTANQSYLQKLKEQKAEQQGRRLYKVQKLREKEQSLKKNLKSNAMFGINRGFRLARLKSQGSLKVVSEQFLL